jgi:hypothetical protein
MDYLQEVLFKERISEQENEIASLKADNELLRNLSFRDERDSLKAQLAECKKEGLEMRKSLINWHSKAFLGTDQTLVIDRDYPYFAAQKEEA